MKNPGTALALVVVFLVMTGSVAPANVLVAVLVGGAVARWIGPATSVSATEGLRRLVFVPRFVVGVAAEIGKGTAAMWRVLIGRRSWRTAGNLQVPLGGRSQRGAEIHAMVLSASPGSVLVEIEPGAGQKAPPEGGSAGPVEASANRRFMLVNVVDASEPEEVRAGQEAFYERYQRPLVP